MPDRCKRLLIVSIDRKVNTFLQTTIGNIIGNSVHVESRTLDEIEAGRVPADVVMTSGAFVYGRLKHWYPDVPVIAPTRLITGYNLEKVLMIPRGTRVLVVNYPKEASQEAIDSLINLGITHIQYVPWGEGDKRPPRGIDTAISPGMSHLCPPGIRHLIDIGPRIISIRSFLELLLALGLELDLIESFSTYYHNFLMESSRKLAEVLEQSELLRKYQEVILNQFEDGLVSVDETGHIDIANKAAAHLVGREPAQLVSTHIDELLAQFKHTVNLAEKPPGDAGAASICEFGGRQILLQKIPVASENVVRQIYTLREIARIQRLEKDVRVHLAKKGHVTKYNFDDIWTASSAIRELKEKALHFAATEKNILITGESGTGKELFAHAIHRRSPRREGPFVAVNFAGIPESLIESELFGYEAGAFTGARKGGKTGFFEEAHAGTIFLDEIGDAPLNVQSRLLRVLQEREIMKVGGSRITPIDVRIIAGTNRNLREAMEEKKFRSDLYYRLNTLPLEIPPLREHPEDVLHILNRYLKSRYGFRKDFSAPCIAQLTAYRWPGNVRELVNLAEYICISSRGSRTVEAEHLPRSLTEGLPERTQTPAARPPDLPASPPVEADSVEFAEPVPHLLMLLRDRKHLPTGRRTLVSLLAAKGLSVSEARMKSLLASLRSVGLVRIGSTKQGTALTEQGEAYLTRLLSGGTDGSAREELG